MPSVSSFTVEMEDQRRKGTWAQGHIVSQRPRAQASQSSRPDIKLSDSLTTSKGAGLEPFRERAKDRVVLGLKLLSLLMVWPIPLASHYLLRGSFQSFSGLNLWQGIPASSWRNSLQFGCA